jgi:regulator of replication initiation timing
LSHTYAINIEQRQSCEEISLHDVSRRLDLLTHQFKRHQTESSIVLNELVNSLEACKSLNGTEHLVRENTLLKQENKSLKEDLDGYKNVVTELNTKLTAVKNDKASLLTVI